MHVLTQYFSSLGTTLVTLALATVTATVLFFLARWSWRWFVGLLVVVVVLVFLVGLPRWYDPQQVVNPHLPPLFLNGYWTWVLILLLGMLGSGLALIRSVRAARSATTDVATATETFPDLEAAWREIQLRLSQAQIDLASQRVVLMLAPDEEGAAAVVQAAELRLFAQGPEAPAPIHAYATAEGVLLSCAGASAFGVQDASGTARLETLCHKLLAQSPDCPPVRGVVVLFPIDWAAQPESVTWAAAVRDDLRTIQRLLKLRCPVFALVPQMESMPGFPEFLARMPPEMRHSRVGFAVPASHAFSGDLVNRGLIWMAGWFHNWILSHMANDLFNQEGNGRLFCLGHEVRRARKRLRAILDAAFSTHRELEPVPFRGCYFLATGDDPAAQGFAAGLLRGGRGRVLADHTTTDWTLDAEQDDQRYRRIARAVGLGGATLSLLAWIYILRLTESPLWWAGLIALVLVWVGVLTRLSLRL